MKYLKRVIIFLTFVLIFNLIWEFSHYQLYLDLTGIPPTIHLIGAAFVDVLLVSFIILCISLLSKNFILKTKPVRSHYLLFIILSLTLAFVWELIHLNLGRWEYLSSMPTIFGVGLSPTLQLAVTGSLALLISSRINF
jgi:hypothetical protein